jgi:hypothetical protein
VGVITFIVELSTFEYVIAIIFFYYYLVPI